MKVMRKEIKTFFTDHKSDKEKGFNKVFSYIGSFIFMAGLFGLFYVMYLVAYACM